MSDSVDHNSPGGERCLVFLHVPKTGGQTFRSALVLNYQASETIHLDTLDQPLREQMGAIPLEERRAARLLWGHMPFGAHEYMPQGCSYVTILRDPVARVISVYKYILRAQTHVLHRRVTSDDVTLEEYVESGMDEGQTENSQTRQLSGRQFGALDPDALSMAQQNLASFHSVGLTEHFEETFVLLRRTLNLRKPVYVTRNVSSPLRISQRAVELVRERNELDLALYAYARDRFSQQIAAQGKYFGAEVKFYRRMRLLSRAGGKVDSWRRQLSRS